MNDLKYVQLAHQLNTQHHDELLKKQLHFRGNINSMSLISLHKETPELGRSNIKTEATALKWLDRGLDLELGRTTREKELQAWLIQDALKNDHRLYFDKGLQFITSELALYETDGTRVVNDILAIDQDNDLVVIELKSTRDKTRIQAQVDNFIRIIQKNKALFDEIVSLHTHRKWSGKIRGVVVWPNSSQMKRKIKTDYREFVYIEGKAAGKKVILYDQKNNIQFKELV